MVPLLSIVIPTKNRYNCLFPVLDTFIKNIVGDNYEIVLQDNTEDNRPILSYLAAKNEPKIKYFYTKEHLDIVRNCNKAIDNSIGKYLCMIGDDDLVSPYIMQIVAMIDEQSVECLTYTAGNYLWPQVTVIKPDKYNAPATMTLYANYSTILTVRYSQTEMRRVLKMGGLYFLGLPRLYHGIVRRDVLQRLKDKFGGNTYFPGPSPDMAISAALSTILDHYHYMNYPVTITGVSVTSGAGLGVRNAHVGRIEEQAHLPKSTIEQWDKYIPRIWTGFTIYAESLHEVFDTVGIKERVNYLNLYAAMYQHEPYTRDYIRPVAELFCKDNNLSVWQYQKACIMRFPRKVLGCAIEGFKRRMNKNYAIKDIKVVEKCMEFLLERTQLN